MSTAAQTNTAAAVDVQASEASAQTGYRSFTLGGFTFSRDEYFARVCAR
jgi:hypothetical protein